MGPTKKKHEHKTNKQTRLDTGQIKKTLDRTIHSNSRGLIGLTELTRHDSRRTRVPPNGLGFLLDSLSLVLLTVLLAGIQDEHELRAAVQHVIPLASAEHSVLLLRHLAQLATAASTSRRTRWTQLGAQTHTLDRLLDLFLRRLLEH